MNSLQLHKTVSRLAVLAASLWLASACQVQSEVEEGEWLPGGDTTNTLLFGSSALMRSADNISFDHGLMFATGNSYFNQPWVQAPSNTETRDGLGPTFNARSCSACHFRDGRGRPPLDGDEEFLSMLIRLSVPGAPGAAAVPDPNYGGQLQPFAIADVPAEGRPRLRYEEIAGTYSDGEPYTLLDPHYSIEDLSYGELAADIMLSARVAPGMVGLGLLQAIPEERLVELSDPDDDDGDGISGRMNWVAEVGNSELVPGRFGWKAEQPSVRQQAAGAFRGDMGITSDEFNDDSCPAVQVECNEARNGGEPEINAHLMDRIEVYAMLVAVPARQDWKSSEVLRGKGLFRDAGCDSCHTPHHTSGELAGFTELSNQEIWPYTDLLLHDMGEALSDKRPVFAAEGAEWRTPPLWALRFYPVVNRHDRLLHDGRARGVAEAILWHGGEAEASQQAFVNMSKSERDALVGFVESL